MLIATGAGRGMDGREGEFCDSKMGFMCQPGKDWTASGSELVLRTVVRNKKINLWS